MCDDSIQIQHGYGWYTPYGYGGAIVYAFLYSLYTIHMKQIKKLVHYGDGVYRGQDTDGNWLAMR